MPRTQAPSVAAGKRRPLYGRRPDGRARNPWKRKADAQHLGYRSTPDFRRHYGEQHGYDPGAIFGRPRRGEEAVSAIRRQWDLLPGAPISREPRQASAFAKLESDVGRLKSGQLLPPEFDWLWGGRRIGDYQVPSADELLVFARQTGPSPDRPYRRIGKAA